MGAQETFDEFTLTFKVTRKPEIKLTVILQHKGHTLNLLFSPLFWGLFFFLLNKLKANKLSFYLSFSRELG